MSDNRWYNTPEFEAEMVANKIAKLTIRERREIMSAELDLPVSYIREQLELDAYHNAMKVYEDVDKAKVLVANSKMECEKKYIYKDKSVSYRYSLRDRKRNVWAKMTVLALS